MNYLLFALAAVVATLSGCASIDQAGVASYRVSPVQIGERIVCCAVDIQNGKEIAELDARIEKRGDDYTVVLRERAVVAFPGQKIAADSIDATASVAAKAAAGILVAPALSGFGAAAVGALAK